MRGVGEWYYPARKRWTYDLMILVRSNEARMMMSSRRSRPSPTRPSSSSSAPPIKLASKGRSSSPSSSFTDPLLLWCGVFASTTFVLADIISSKLASQSSDEHDSTSSSSYSTTYNSISELLTPNAPPLSRYVGIVLMVLSDVLGILFGFSGMLRAAGSIVASSKPIVVGGGGRIGNGSSSRSYTIHSGGSNAPFQQRLHIRLAVYRGGMLLGLASLCNLISATLCPQDVRGEPSTFAGRIHLILVAASALLSLPAMYFLSSAIQNEAFQQYTAFTVSLLFAGGLCSPLAARIGLLGIAERVSAYAYVTWQAVLALILMYRTSSERKSRDARRRLNS